MLILSPPIKNQTHLFEFRDTQASIPSLVGMIILAYLTLLKIWSKIQCPKQRYYWTCNCHSKVDLQCIPVFSCVYPGMHRWSMNCSLVFLFLPLLVIFRKELSLCKERKIMAIWKNLSTSNPDILIKEWSTLSCNTVDMKTGGHDEKFHEYFFWHACTLLMEPVQWNTFQ